MSKEKTNEEILAKIEIDKIHAKSTAKEIASRHLGKHAINYITVLVIIGVISSTSLEGGALTAVIGLVSTAAMAMIGILQHIVGAVEKEEKGGIRVVVSGDRKIEPASATCIHDIAGLASASCEVYDGVTRYQDVSWFGKLRLRAFPSKVERSLV